MSEDMLAWRGWCCCCRSVSFKKPLHKTSRYFYCVHLICVPFAIRSRTYEIQDALLHYSHVPRTIFNLGRSSSVVSGDPEGNKYGTRKLTPACLRGLIDIRLSLLPYCIDVGYYMCNHGAHVMRSSSVYCARNAV